MKRCIKSSWLTGFFLTFSGIHSIQCSQDSGAQGLPAAGGPEASPPPAITLANQTGQADAKPTPELNAPSERTAEVYVGTLLPIYSAELGPKRSGTLQSVEVDEGDTVKKGQVLFRLETQAIRLNIQQNAEALKSAKLRLQEAKRELDRHQKLVEKGSIASATFEHTQATYDEVDIAVRRAQVGLSLAKRDQIDSTVTSPVDGIVVRKLKNVGETVTMMPPTTILVIQDQSVLELRFRTPEDALRIIKSGQQMTARFPAVELERTATVKRIQPIIDPVTRTVEVVAFVDNQDNSLKPGMYVEVMSQKPNAPAPTPTANNAKPAQTTDGAS